MTGVRTLRAGYGSLRRAICVILVMVHPCFIDLDCLTMRSRSRVIEFADEEAQVNACTLAKLLPYSSRTAGFILCKAHFLHSPYHGRCMCASLSATLNAQTAADYCTVDVDVDVDELAEDQGADREYCRWPARCYSLALARRPLHNCSLTHSLEMQLVFANVSDPNGCTTLAPQTWFRKL